MSDKTLVSFRALTLIGALIGCPQLWAAESLDDDLRGTDQLIVSASRAALQLNRVGNAVTVIDQEQIERRQARYVTDLLRSVPGFAISRSGVEGTQTQVRVRGSEANHVLVLIDGVRANDPATSDEFRWEQLTTANIERIEIVRGPQSALWGSDAIAGVVNIITTDGADTSAISAYTDAGSNSSLNAGLSGVLSEANWRFNAGVERLKTDGENISRAGDEKDDSETTTANFGARYAGDSGLTLNFGLRAVDSRTQTDPVDFGTGLPADADRVTDAKTLAANVSARLKSASGKVANRVSLRWFDSDNRFLVDGAEDAATLSDRLTVAWQSDFSLGADALSLAVEHEVTRYEQRGAVGFGDPNQKQKIDVTSLVMDYQGRIGEQLSWLLGGRYDENSDFDDSLNGRLALAWNTDESLTLRGSVGTGQKNPTFTERFGFFPAMFIGNPDLQPEKSISYEFGFDKRFLGGDLETQVSVFRQNLKDEINGFVAVPGGFTALNVAGKSRRSGAELSASWQLHSRVELGGNYTYIDSEQKDAAGVKQAEIRRPRHSGSVWTRYDSEDERFSASLNVDYSGTQTDTFFPPFPAPSEAVSLGRRWLVDLTAQYAVTGELTVFVRGANLLDEDYEEVYGYNTLGRAAYLGLRANFGD